MNIDQFAWRMLALIPQISRGVARYEHNDLTRGEITLPQLWVLGHLADEGETKMSAMAQCHGISKPAATGLIDRLIIQGLVSRRDDQKDRRIIWITITPKGNTILQNIRKQKHRTLVKLFGAISAADRKKYLDILEKVVKTLDTNPQIKKPLPKKEI